MAVLFISDLHLDAQRPAITDLFLTFLEQRAVTADALYILGDLFEAWIGDDDDEPLGRVVASALKILNNRGISIYFIHGNRDFMLGADFASSSGIELLPEATVINLYGTPTLIMHGDTLCTDDTDYQALRIQMRSAQWQAQMLALPLAQRRMMARKIRAGSQQAMQQKADDIVDVNSDAVVNAMKAHGVYRLIHGHTHRPHIHDFGIDGKPAQRIVLGDWYEQGSALCCDAEGCRMEGILL